MKKYFLIIVYSFLYTAKNRKEIFVRCTFFLTVLYIFSKLWQATQLPDQSSQNLMIWYLSVTELIVLSIPLIQIDIEHDIRSGDIAYQLLKPISYFWLKIFECIGAFFFRFLVLMLVSISFCTYLSGYIPSLSQLCIVYFMAGLAGLVFILFHTIIGLLAFKLQDSSPIFSVWQRCSFLFGGLLIPLDFYPYYLKIVSYFLPFASLLYAPARLVIEFNAENFFVAMSGLLFWGIVALFLGNSLFVKLLKSVKIAHIKISIKSALSLKQSFFIQSVLMLLSNMVIFSFWWIYFDNFSSIKGWTLADMACLYGIVTAAYGIFSVFLGGSRYLARMISEGDLDALIVRPKNLLMQIACSKSVPSGWGDILTSIVFFIISGYLIPSNIPFLLLFISTACLIIMSFSIIMGSLGFWLEDSHTISKQIFEFLLTFSNYPKSIYVGAIKIFLLTVIPSGFIGFMPIETIKNHSLTDSFYILAFSFVYFFCAYKIFYFGLNKYVSGNKSGFKV